MSLVIRTSERFSLPLAYRWDDYGPFKQQSFQARLVLHF